MFTASLPAEMLSCSCSHLLLLRALAHRRDLHAEQALAAALGGAGAIGGLTLQ